MRGRILKILAFLAILAVLDWLVAMFFQKGMERYYGLNREADILIVGHSHLMKTCNKDTLEKELGVRIAKYCREGVMAPERYGMVRHFLESQQDHSVPIVLYGVDPLLFHSVSSNAYKLFYPFMDVEAMDELVRQGAKEWYDYPLHKYVRSSRFSDLAIYRSIRGWLGYWESLSDGIISDKQWKRHIPWGVHMPETSVKAFHDTIKLLVDSGSHVVLVYPGIIQAYRTSNPEAYAYMINYFREMADAHPRIDFWDYSAIFSHRQELFEDSVHINRAGEKIFTRRLISDLRVLMQRG